jgi:hypothetical protein
MPWIRSHLTFANVISMLALFVALGGTGYAATQLAKNSVGAKQIKKNAVGASEIKPNAVRSADVKEGALQAIDFAAGQLPAGAKGDKGDPGAKGDKGDKGEKGDAGATNTVLRRGVETTVQPDSSASASVSCLAGETATGGGLSVSNGAIADMLTWDTGPIDSNGDTKPDGWEGRARNVDSNNSDTGTITVRAELICTSP